MKKRPSEADTMPVLRLKLELGNSRPAMWKLCWLNFKVNGLTRKEPKKLSQGCQVTRNKIKNVVNLCMKGYGIRWANERTENTLNFRVAYLSPISPAREFLKSIAL